MLLCAGLRLRLGRGRRQNSEGRSKAESYPLTPFARGLPGFCTEGRKPQDASQSCDNQDGWSPHCIKPPKPAGRGGPVCSLDWCPRRLAQGHKGEGLRPPVQPLACVSQVVPRSRTPGSPVALAKAFSRDRVW